MQAGWELTISQSSLEAVPGSINSWAHQFHTSRDSEQVPGWWFCSIRAKQVSTETIQAFTGFSRTIWSYQSKLERCDNAQPGVRQCARISCWASEAVFWISRWCCWSCQDQYDVDRTVTYRGDPETAQLLIEEFVLWSVLHSQPCWYA